MKIKVIAMENSFWHGSLRMRAGREYEIDDALIPRERDEKEGNEVYVFPRWMRPACDVSRRMFARQQELAEEKSLAGAIAAAGNQGKTKKDTFIEVMRGGQDVTPAEAAALAASSDKGAKAKKKAYEEAVARGAGPQTSVK